MALPLANPVKRDYDLPVTSRPMPAPQVLRLWHLASFDAPTVAVVWAYAFAAVAGVHLQPWIALLLFSGTWSVYVGDRLLDAHRAIRSGQFSTLRERHFFHWRHRHSLIPLASCSAAVAAALIVHLMPVVIRERNSALAAAALMYFSGVHSPSRLPVWLRKTGAKEMLVGVLFTAGCVAPALSQMHLAGMRFRVGWPLLVCFTYFAGLAWSNCRVIDSWESGDAGYGVFLHAGLLTLAGAALTVALAWSHTEAGTFVFTATLSSFLLLLLDRMRSRFSPLMLRILADAVLLTPAVLLAFRVGSA